MPGLARRVEPSTTETALVTASGLALALDAGFS